MFDGNLSSAISIIQLIQYLALEISSAFSRVSLSSFPSGGVYTCLRRFEGKGKYTCNTRTLYITLVRREVTAHGTSRMLRTRLLPSAKPYGHQVGAVFGPVFWPIRFFGPSA